MPKASPKNQPAKRILAYRRRMERSGLNRVEVTVPASDVAHVKALAHALREGGAQADQLRAQLQDQHLPQTGATFLARLRRGAQDGFEIETPQRAREELRETGL